MDKKEIKIAVQQNEINNLNAININLQVELEKMARSNQDLEKELETYKEDNARLEESQSH